MNNSQNANLLSIAVIHSMAMMIDDGLCNS